MNEETRTAPGPRAKRLAGVAGLLAAGALVGGVATATLPASADDTTSTATSTTPAVPAVTAAPRQLRALGLARP